MKMEAWVPLFEIFLNSPCPESEASLWLQKNFNPSSNSTPISTASLISLLTRPVDDSSTQGKKVVRIETLPFTVQARIFSFLAYDHRRFCKKDLCRLARVVLSGEGVLDFWVKKAAHQLLDLLPVSNNKWISHLNLDSEEENTKDEELFSSMPDWLKDADKDGERMFPWLPMLPDEFNENIPESTEGDFQVDMDESNQELELGEVVREVNMDETSLSDPIDEAVEIKAKSLKTRLRNLESAPNASELAKDIRELCLQTKRGSLVILTSVEPWVVDDETAAVLISHLCSTNEVLKKLDWPAHVLCSFVLPKFLSLKEPSSRVLMMAVIEYCKAHQRAAEYALLFPLILRKEGLNSPICDVITRIVKDCLHPAQVSAFCQKVLCGDRNEQRFVCLACHRCLIGEDLVFTEYLFCLWQNILNCNVRLTRDSVDELVRRVCEFSAVYSKSLRFGNFVLCLVSKCGVFVKPHKCVLTAAVEKTESLVTKSILSKLSSL
ncbi:heparin cofactor 2 [Striga asiatica]|uniref:Heparin cofactor 2 n=1 Tax=Striga asiatica TaxID=4170 RepID=A0A5A7PYC2_STRAF|nr:heparin cofactor 2 [Striga asiatica]